MKIPQRYQVFDTKVEISEKDEQRLSAHLSGWVTLHEMFLLGLNAPDLRRLIVLEMIKARRKDILRRLLGRLSATERSVRQEKIFSIVSTP